MPPTAYRDMPRRRSVNHVPRSRQLIRCQNGHDFEWGPSKMVGGQRSYHAIGSFSNQATQAQSAGSILDRKFRTRTVIKPPFQGELGGAELRGHLPHPLDLHLHRPRLRAPHGPPMGCRRWDFWARWLVAVRAFWPQKWGSGSSKVRGDALRTSKFFPQPKVN